VDFSEVSSADFSFISVIGIALFSPVHICFSSVHVSCSSGDVFLFFDCSSPSLYNRQTTCSTNFEHYKIFLHLLWNKLQAMHYILGTIYKAK
jgi:hypothetical protein